MRLTIRADRERCIGSGQCTVYAAATFTQDDEAKVVVLPDPRDDLDAIRVAVDACPTRALQLIETGG
jgi:ferredoxin